MEASKHLAIRYDNLCKMSLSNSTAMVLFQAISSKQGAESVMFATEAWNVLSLNEIHNSSAYFALSMKETSTTVADTLPVYRISADTEVLSAHKLAQMAIPVSSHRVVKAQSVKRLRQDSEFVSASIFRSFNTLPTVDNQLLKKHPTLLETFDLWKVMKTSSTNGDDDIVCIFNENMVPVPDFMRKLNVVLSQLKRMPWDVSTDKFFVVKEWPPTINVGILSSFYI